MAELLVHPKKLADLIANAVDIGKDKASISIGELIALKVDADRLYSYGRGRYSAGRDWIEIEEQRDPEWITITEAEATALASTLRAVEGAGRKETLVKVSLTDRNRLTIYSGETLCDLPDADPASVTFGAWDELSDWDEVDAMIVAAEQASPQPWRLMFGTEMLTRLNKIRGGNAVIDFAQLPNGRGAGVALGPTFRGVASGCGRDSYSKGGKWGDGPGKPIDLWESSTF